MGLEAAGGVEQIVMRSSEDYLVDDSRELFVRKRTGPID
jgi:hypothetical protein